VKPEEHIWGIILILILLFWLSLYSRQFFYSALIFSVLVVADYAAVKEVISKRRHEVKQHE
jgi:hypothetical protein